MSGIRKPASQGESSFEDALRDEGLDAGTAGHAPQGRRPNPRREANEFPFAALDAPERRHDGVIGDQGHYPEFGDSKTNPAWRGYDHGLLPAHSVRASVGGASPGSVDIAEGQFLPATMGPGIWVVCGQPSGYQVSVSKGGADPYYDLSCSSVIRSNLALAFRVDPTAGTPPGDLVLAFYPVKKTSEEDFKKAADQGRAFAGMPLLQYPAGLSPSAQTTPWSLTLQSPLQPSGPMGPTYFFGLQIPGSIAGSIISAISNINNDASGGGSVFLADSEANANGSAANFFEGNPPGTGGFSGIQLSPGGTYDWTGEAWMTSGEVEGDSGTVQADIAAAVQVPGTPANVAIQVTDTDALVPIYLATTAAVANAGGNGGTPATGIKVLPHGTFLWPANAGALWVGALAPKPFASYVFVGATQYASGGIS